MDLRVVPDVRGTNAIRDTTMKLVFEPIDLERQPPYLRRLAQCGQIASDYSFINLWSWAEEYGLQWAWQENLVWIKQARPMETFWAPVGNWEAVDWTVILQSAADCCPRIIRVPEGLLEIWKTQSQVTISIEETRDHWDYLYNRQELVNLAGKRFHKKKNLLNQFKNKYEAVYLPFSPDMVAQAKGMQEDWCTWRDCENSDTLASENKAIAKVLDNWQHLSGVTGGALRVGRTLAAYTVAEVMSDNTLVIHFEKGCPDFKGSYQAINQMFLENDESSCTLVNREQDLGDQGLRKAKLSYNPVDFVRKYQVTL
jgi:hypothetical protein